MENTFSYSEFILYIPVSRETFMRMQLYMELLRKWQTRINLVSNVTVRDMWLRHAIDSAQLFSHLPHDDAVVDVGSGAGFPGLIVSIMGIKKITLVESDVRKVVFLREAARITNTQVAIVNKRIEAFDIEPFSFITARAFAVLETVFRLLGSGLRASHKLLLLKGKNYEYELDAAKKDWSFDCKVFPSITHKEGVILLLENVTKRSMP